MIPTRSIRLLKLYDILASGPYFNVNQLIAELKVSRRTVFRDLDVLRRAGVDICFDPTREAYSLTTRSRTSDPPIKSEHLILIAIAAQLSPLNDIQGLGKEIRHSLRQLMKLLSEQTRQEIGSLLHACRLAPSPMRRHVSADVIKTLWSAIRTGNSVRLHRTGFPSDDGQTIVPHRVRATQDGMSVEGRSLVDQSWCEIDLAEIDSVEVLHQSHVTSAPAGAI